MLGDMLSVGHVYLEHRCISYDVCVEIVDGQTVYVAMLCEDPRLNARAPRPETAVALLMSYLGQQMAGA